MANTVFEFFVDSLIESDFVRFSNSPYIEHKYMIDIEKIFDTNKCKILPDEKAVLKKTFQKHLLSFFNVFKKVPSIKFIDSLFLPTSYLMDQKRIELNLNNIIETFCHMESRKEITKFDFKYNPFAFALIHEMTHAWQHHTGLIFKSSEINKKKLFPQTKIIYKGKKFARIGNALNGVDHFSLPFEIEANTMAAQFCEQFKYFSSDPDIYR